MTDTNALLPCPFCGERAETDFIPEHHSYQVECCDVFGCTARVTRDSELGAVEAWNLRAPALAAPAQPVGWAIFAENGNACMWTQSRQNAEATAKDIGLQITPLYAAPQSAVPRNAPLYNPDDVAFPVQRSADGADALPPELTSIAKRASTAAAEVAAPIKAGEYPPLACDYCGALTPDPWHSSGMLHGKMSKHIHSCDVCAARG